MSTPKRFFFMSYTAQATCTSCSAVAQPLHWDQSSARKEAHDIRKLCSHVPTPWPMSPHVTAYPVPRTPSECLAGVCPAASHVTLAAGIGSESLKTLLRIVALGWPEKCPIPDRFCSGGTWGAAREVFKVNFESDGSRLQSLEVSHDHLDTVWSPLPSLD